MQQVSETLQILKAHSLWHPSLLTQNKQKELPPHLNVGGERAVGVFLHL
jgi:hypothetical protein